MDTLGAFIQGGTVNITGSGFGTKNPAKPLLWADFESSINPDGTLGTKSAWDRIGCLTRVTGAECPENSGGCIRSTNASADCFEVNGVVMGVSQTGTSSWNYPNTSFYVYQKHKLNFEITDNWKNYRFWPTSATYPNMHFTVYNTRTTLESQTNSGMINADDHRYLDNPSVLPTPNIWFAEEFMGKTGDRWPTVNGEWILYREGLKYFDLAMVMRDTLGAAEDIDMTTLYVVHDVAAGLQNGDARWPLWDYTNNRTWYDDVYVDRTWSRVMICAGSTWANRGHCEIQIPTVWSCSGPPEKCTINAVVNKGSFVDGNKVYLFVVDATNTANTDGYEVTIGGGSSDTIPPAAPTRLSVQ